MRKLNNGSEKVFSSLGNVDEKWFALASEDFSPAEKAKFAAKSKRKSFVAYEIQKLFGVKYLWIFMAVFILLNSALAFYTAGKTPAAAEPSALIADFFAKYEENPAELDAYYVEILAFNEEQNRLFYDAMAAGNYDFTPETLPDVYSADEKFHDRELFAKLYNAITAASEYPDVMQRVIDRAYSNLDEFEQMGIGKDSFTYKYQLRVIKLYENLRDNVRIDVDYSHGWSEYFDYTIVNLFIFFLIIMTSGVIFTEEKQTGILPMLRTAKNGRLRTAAAKIIASTLVTVFVTLTFTATTFAVFGLRLGYSSPENALQSLEKFTLSPYMISIGGYFALTIGIKLVAFSVFSLVILALSTIFYNYIMIYLCGLGLFGLNFLLTSMSFLDSGNPFKNLNLVALSSATPVFARYRAVNFFGNVAGYLPFTLVTSAIIIAAAVIFTLIRFDGGREFRPVIFDGLHSRLLELKAKISKFFRNISLPTRKHRYSMSLFSAEIYKTLISSRFIIVVLLILGLKCVYSVKNNLPLNSYSDSVYKEYMTRLEGELTDEKREFLRNEREMIDSTLSKQTLMQQKYVNDEITFDEYRAYLSDYNYAYSRSDLLKLIERHADYIEEKSAETGINGWFCYDTGWKKLYSGDADLFLYTSILLLLTGTFASEYLARSSSGGFSQILRATKNGRDRTFFAKLISSGTIAVTLALLFNAVDLIVIFSGCEMPSASAPLISIEIFGSVTSRITIGGYLIVFLALRIAASLIMAMLVCALSELLCRYIPILGSVALLTLLPGLFAYFGLAAADKVSFLNLLAGTPIFIESAKCSLFGSGWSMLALWIAAAGCAVFAMLVPAKKMFVK